MVSPLKYILYIGFYDPSLLLVVFLLLWPFLSVSFTGSSSSYWPFNDEVPQDSVLTSVSSLLLFSCLVVSDSSSMDCSMPGFPVLHHLLELVQTHVHWVGDAIQPSHLLPPLSPFSFNLPQHQGLFQWVGSLHQVPKVLEFQLQHQSCQWIFRVDSL